MVHAWFLALYQNDSTSDMIAIMTSGVMVIVWLAVIVVAIVGMWKMFTKAGQPGWGGLIPFYNVYLMCLIAGRPGWWLILFLIPFVNFVIGIIVALDIAKAFGKGVGFGIGLAFLAPIFYAILGFGSATYQGPPNH